MKVGTETFRSIWLNDDSWSVSIIDQTLLPHRFEIVTVSTLAEAEVAIKSMQVRGAPLIGAMAAFGLCIALRDDASDKGLRAAVDNLAQTRPTAINLRCVLDGLTEHLMPLSPANRIAAAYARTAEICDEDISNNRMIGLHGLEIIRDIANRNKGGNAADATVNILTHCNAGWLATVDWGTALAPVYMAHDAGIAVHVWVGETRPRNQGAALTAWELGQHGVPHSLIVDNVGGHLMQHGMVDLCITGTDRTTATGDVCNKIGTYLKALAAADNNVPFYVALPSPSIDWSISDGLGEIPIEQRGEEEVTQINGINSSGSTASVVIAPPTCRAVNYAFDVTPARLVTGLITERGICPATASGLRTLFPDKADNQ